LKISIASWLFKYLSSYDNSCWEYLSKSSTQNCIQIDSLNKVARVLIGRFQFIGIDSICQDTVRVTEGRFKASYWYRNSAFAHSGLNLVQNLTSGATPTLNDESPSDLNP